jgi:hypothetical protein
VDPNILATGGATTGYASTSKPLPRNNPGDNFSLHFSSTILFEENNAFDMWKIAKFQKRQHYTRISLTV